MQPELLTRIFLFVTLLLLLPAASQAQLLGDPVDVSHDFQRLENVYFVGSRVTSFDASTGQGTLQWDRYLRNTTLSFNKIEERKSTRLNSSHLVISYAVFCLKKKKKTEFEHM